jgi:hypothetical protein
MIKISFRRDKPCPGRPFNVLKTPMAGLLYGYLSVEPQMAIKLMPQAFL